MTGSKPPATPAATPVIAVPFGIDRVDPMLNLTPADVEANLKFLPETVAGLPLRQTQHDAGSATAVFLIEQDPQPPRFGSIVVLQVTPSDDADAFIQELETKRWGDPTEHDLTGSGDGTGDAPAYRIFSRTFMPGGFLIPYRPVYFVLWYRAGDEWAFMVIADSAELREALASATTEIWTTSAD